MDNDDSDYIGHGTSRRERIGQERRRYSQRQTYIFPRPSRVTSREHRLHSGAWVALAIILGLLGGIGYWIYNYQYATETSVTVTVDRLDDQASGSTHKYLIFTRGADGRPGEVFQDTDAWFHGKFNSSDVFAALQPGQTYQCDVYGRRNHFTSTYRNIISCIPIQAWNGRT